MPTEGWTDFFVATAGAAAALAGLVIVAISVNVQRILEYSNLPSRAAATISSLVLILVVACAGLIPVQSIETYGLEVAAFALLCWLPQIPASRHAVEHARSSGQPMRETVSSIAVGQLQFLPFAVAAILLLAGDGTGLSWLAAGILMIFIGAMLNAWVLLVEILR